jgi:hypothetical protein
MVHLTATLVINPLETTSRPPLRRSNLRQNVPSAARVAAGAFEFLIFSHTFDGPDLYGASSFFETMPSRPSLQTAWTKKDISKNAIDVAFGGKADMTFCGAHVGF